MKIDVKELNLKYKELLDTEVIIDGWVRSNRDQSTLGFIDLMMELVLKEYKLFILAMMIFIKLLLKYK